jgi:hypothetical protein
MAAFKPRTCELVNLFDRAPPSLSASTSCAGSLFEMRKTSPAICDKWCGYRDGAEAPIACTTFEQETATML